MLTFFQVPGEAEEPTSTIVLTSQNSHYVDVRVYKDLYQSEVDENHERNSISTLEWAFAGTSSTTVSANEPGEAKPLHSVWEHWIDSKSDDPRPDEGDMWPQDNGDVLERGTQIHPVTGLQTGYEELWGDMEVEKVGEDKERVSIVLKFDEVDGNLSRGMIVRVGRWCQGIIKSDGLLAIERWHWIDEVNKWERVVNIGDGNLPCAATFETRLTKGKSTVASHGQEWKVVETFTW